MKKYSDTRCFSKNEKVLQASRILRSQQGQIKQKGFMDDFGYGNSKVIGIKNIGNNCYLNSGLQILASCEELVYLLRNYKLNKNNIAAKLNEAFNQLLYGDGEYNPYDFINCFCSKNIDFIKGTQCCSQNFIRTLIRNINDNYLSSNFEIVSSSNEYNPSNDERAEYIKFLNSNKIYPESKAISLFSGITKSHSFGKCPKCRELINNYSFSYFIDQNIYLDECKNKEYYFSEVLRKNIGNNNTLSMDCPKCYEEIEINEKTKIVKLPKILIFTLERYQGPTNNVPIIPDYELEMKDYIDNSLKVDETLYELFAINIRFGRTANFGHEICQVKRKKKWYEINDYNGNEISNVSHFDCSYGLFYRKKKKETDKQINEQISYIGKNNYQKPNNNIKIYNYNKDEQESQSKNINDINKDNNYDYNENNIGDYNSKNNNQMSYLNTGFQIIASCSKLIDFLNKNDRYKIPIVNLAKNIIDNILKNEKIPDLTEFSKSFSKKNNDFFTESKCNSQYFIRTLLYYMKYEFKKSKTNQVTKNNDYNNGSDEYKSFEKRYYPYSKIF